MEKLFKLLEAGDYDAAYAHFNGLEESQRKVCFEDLCRKKDLILI